MQQHENAPWSEYFSVKTLETVKHDQNSLHEFIVRCQEMIDKTPNNIMNPTSADPDMIVARCKRIQDIAEVIYKQLCYKEAKKTKTPELGANKIKHSLVNTAMHESHEAGELIFPVETKNSAIVSYLTKDVDAVDLPELFRAETTFAPLIIDGASGVGKTQQAFALLRSKETLIYLNLSDIRTYSQQIYWEMEKISTLQQAISIIDDAINDLETLNKEGYDCISLDALEDLLQKNKFSHARPKTNNFELLITELLENRLRWSKEGLRKVPIDYTLDDISKVLKTSNKVVLFVDEALSRNKFQSSQERHSSRKSPCKN